DAAPAFAAGKALADTAIAADGITTDSGASAPLADAVTATDAAPVLAAGKAIADTATPTDVGVRAVTRATSDSIAASDSLAVGAGRAVADAVGITDASPTLASGKTVADSVSSGDSVGTELTSTGPQDLAPMDAVIAKSGGTWIKQTY